MLPAIVSWLLVYFDELPQALQNDSWLDRWARWVDEAIVELFGNVAALAVTLLVPIAAFIVVLALFGGWLLGFMGVVITVAALIYSCGRENYVDKISEYKAHLSSTDEPNALALRSHSVFCRQLIYAVYQRWFVTIIWFLLLGIAGALFYRLCYLIAEQSASPSIDQPDSSTASITEACATLVSWFDWLPLRLWVLLVAASSNFSAVFTAVKNDFFAVGQHHILLDKTITAWLKNGKNALPDEPQEKPLNAETVTATQLLEEIDSLEVLGNSCMVFGLGLVLILMFIF
jgi:membrane protein required for beta-lactamase induction